MKNTEVCMLAGKISAGEYALMEKHASQGCKIAFMDTNKELGKQIKSELEKVYGVAVFFFHGDVNSEEDRDIFSAAVEEMFGKADYIICHND